jgi:predicted lipoprotein with Yx(FWY)xxD motif
MPKQAPAARAAQKTPKRHVRTWLALGAIAAAALITVVATALAAGSSLTLSSNASSMLGKPVVVNPQGRTLYRLSPETSKHLLCKSKECLTNWSPLTVKSAKTKLKAGSGVKGKLGLLHRSNGTLQATLNGLPLYRYSGDSAKDDVNGEGIESFGGTWHAVRASSSASTTPTTTGTTTTPTTPTTTTTTPTTTSPEPPPYKY